MKYKTLPNSELEIMVIIWKANRPLTRMEIEEHLPEDRQLSKTTVLSFLSRLEEKGFVKTEKQGRNNYYYPLIRAEEYQSQEGSSVLKKLYDNSVKKFVASLYDGKELSKEQIDELKDYLNSL